MTYRPDEVCCMSGCLGSSRFQRWCSAWRLRLASSSAAARATRQGGVITKHTATAVQVSYKELVDKFFSIHDPTTLNRQKGDAGTQYRSGESILHHRQACPV